jgi:hypothetical protein
MKQEEVEASIREHLEAIWDIYNKYHSDGEYLSISFTKVNPERPILCNCVNAYWTRDEDMGVGQGEDSDTPINFSFYLGECNNEQTN